MQGHKHIHIVSKHNHTSMHHSSSYNPKNYRTQPQANLLYHKHYSLREIMAIDKARLVMHSTFLLHARHMLTEYATQNLAYHIHNTMRWHLKKTIPKASKLAPKYATYDTLQDSNWI